MYNTIIIQITAALIRNKQISSGGKNQCLFFYLKMNVNPISIFLFMCFEIHCTQLSNDDSSNDMTFNDPSFLRSFMHFVSS